MCTLLCGIGWYCKQVIGQDVCGKIPIVLIGKQEVVDLKDKLDKEDLKTSRWTCSRPQGQGGQGEFAQHGRESQGLVHCLPLQRMTKDYALPLRRHFDTLVF